MSVIVGKTIDQLNAATAVTANDEIAIYDAEAGAAEPTKKVTGSNLASSIKTLGSLVNTTEMNAAIAQSTASDWSDLSDYFGTLDQGGDSAGTIFRFGKLRVITMRGLSRSHTADEVIATLPAADAPMRQVFAPVNIGAINGIIRVGGNGEITLYGISGTASTGRIFFNIAYVVN